MASTMNDMRYQDRRMSERRRFAYPAVLRGLDGMRVSWGGVWGGVLVALGVLLILAALGVAVGISAVDPAEAQASTLGTGAGIWAGVSLLIALFVGGMVATRIGAIFDRTTGFFEGALVWVVSVLLMVYLAGSGIGMVTGGAFKLIGGATQAITGAVAQNPDASQAAGQNMPQSAEQAKQQAGEMVDQAKQKAGEIAGQAQQKAQEMKPQATKAAWFTFGALILSLIAAVVGAMVGRREPQSQA